MATRIEQTTTDSAVSRHDKPRLGPPRVVVRGAWGRALPPPKPGQKEESIFTSWLMGLLGRPHPDTLDESELKQPARR